MDFVCVKLAYKFTRCIGNLLIFVFEEKQSDVITKSGANLCWHIYDDILSNIRTYTIHLTCAAHKENKMNL